MAIPVSAQFDYLTTVTRDGSGAWVERADPGDERRPHPGLVGARPERKPPDQIESGPMTAQRTPTFPDDGLPRHEVARVQRWWDMNSHRFAEGAR